MRRVFFSFHHKTDNWRAAQIRNIGAIEGNRSVTDNDWESITNFGDAAIKKWIGDQMPGRSCSIVLVGTNTAGRKWINYEIEKTWNDGKGIFGIHVHVLKDSEGEQSTKGNNPFRHVIANGTRLSSLVKIYDTPYITSTYVYDHIRDNITEWTEEAITIRNDN